MEHEFIHKTVFFPQKGILAIGDLHIGYENALVESGFLIPKNQTEETIKEIENVIDKIKLKNQKLEKIIFLGDVKYSFGYKWKEKKEFLKILDFLKTYVKEENIILVKGNHDTMEIGIEMKKIHIEEEIVFLHGHEPLPEIFDKNVKVVVSGHLHPSIVLEEEEGAKKEIFKCFLEGHYGDKKRIVLPSFPNFVEGTPINFYREDYWEGFSIIPEKEIIKFKVHIIGEKEVYEFGSVEEFLL